MNILKLAVAAAIAVSSLTIAAAPADAQRGQRWEHRDGGRNHVRGDRGGRRDWRSNRGRGSAWRYNRGRYHGWRGGGYRYGWGNRYRACRWVWRYHHRQRLCWYTYRRWR
jgi:hypothetical protein